MKPLSGEPPLLKCFSSPPPHTPLLSDVCKNSYHINTEKSKIYIFTRNISSNSCSIKSNTAFTYAWSLNPFRPSPHRKILGPKTIANARGVILLPSELFVIYNINSHKYINNATFNFGTRCTSCFTRGTKFGLSWQYLCCIEINSGCKSSGITGSVSSLRNIFNKLAHAGTSPISSRSASPSKAKTVNISSIKC